MLTPWRAGERSVSYTKKLNLPQALLAVLGDLSSINVVEKQTRTAGALEVVSLPVSKGLERFKTRVTQTVTGEGQENGCTLRTVIRCEAPCIPGFQTLLERQMESVARDSLVSMYEFAHKFVESEAKAGAEAQADTALEVEEPPPPVSQEEPPPEPVETEPVHAPLPQPLMRPSETKRRRESSCASDEPAAGRRMVLGRLRRQLH